MKSRKVLVTGSTGFIGKRLCSHMAELGYEVLGIDKREPEAPPEGWTFQAVDLLDANTVREVLNRFAPSGVLHLAARTDLAETRDLQGYAANIAGVENLIAAVRQTPSVERGVYTSSQLVCRIGYTPRDDRDYCPDTLYGQSKVMTEKIVVEQDGGGAEWCLVRPTTVWGPGMSAHYQRFFRMIGQGRYFHVGRRPLYKSYSYLGNIVHQYVRLLEAPAEQIVRKTYYLADYEPLSLRAWADTIQRELGAKPIPTLPRPLARAAALTGDLANRIGFSRFPFNSFRLNNVLTEYQVDLSRTREVCGPLPYDMNAGVRELVAWLRAGKIV